MREESHDSIHNTPQTKQKKSWTAHQTRPALLREAVTGAEAAAAAARAARTKTTRTSIARGQTAVAVAVIMAIQRGDAAGSITTTIVVSIVGFGKSQLFFVEVEVAGIAHIVWGFDGAPHARVLHLRPGVRLQVERLVCCQFLGCRPNAPARFEPVGG